MVYVLFFYHFSFFQEYKYTTSTASTVCKTLILSSLQC